MNTAHRDGYAEMIKAGRPWMMAVILINIGDNAIVTYVWKVGTAMDRSGIMTTTFELSQGFINVIIPF